MAKGKSIAKEIGLVTLATVCVGLPLGFAVMTFRGAKIALFNLSGVPRAASIQELIDGKIGGSAWVTTKGVRWNDNYVVESNTRWTTNHFLFLSPDDPQLKDWAKVKSALEALSRALNTQQAAALPQRSEAVQFIEEAAAVKLMARLEAAENQIRQFRPSRCIAILGPAPPDFGPLHQEKPGNEVTRAEIQRRLNKALNLMQTDMPVSGIVEPVDEDIKQAFHANGVAAPSVEIDIYATPHRTSLYKFLAAMLVLSLEALLGWRLFRAARREPPAGTSS